MQQAWPTPSKHLDGVIKQASIVCVNGANSSDTFFLCDDIRNRRGRECLSRNFTRKVWGQLRMCSMCRCNIAVKHHCSLADRDAFYCDIASPIVDMQTASKMAQTSKRHLVTTVTNYFDYFTLVWPTNRERQFEYNK